MFSFIKWFSTLIENAKKKKGLWFTLLTTVSLMGIFASLYFVNFLVSDVAQKTYENQKNHYVLGFKNKIISQNEYTEAVALSISKNKDIANEFFSNDENSTKNIDKKSKAIVNKINSALGKKSLSISYEETSKAEKIIGIDITKKGAVFKSSVPMLDKNGTITNVVLTKNIDTLVENYQKEDKAFAFLLTESSSHKIDRALKKSVYESCHDKFYIKSTAYDKSFVDQLKSVDFGGKLEENGFIKDSKYFYVYQKVYDIDGDYAGLAFVAEQVKDDNSFVNLVKNLVNSVTMVALGLIVSMLLFLF
ncbi:MAG TPA: hypothetical protein EYH01_05090 [Campylobacterales bacterium]|nr:hypothetical protein [Campylobacterales bacterium]